MTATASRRHAIVLVLGDVGRSPRMQYHAWSMAEQASYSVDLVGYSGSRCFPSIESHPHIRLHTFKSLAVRDNDNNNNNHNNNTHPSRLSRLSRLFVSFFRLIYSVLFLLFFLLSLRRASVLLLQTPPAVPTLFVTLIYTLLTGTPVVIDWHNLTYTLIDMDKQKTITSTSSSASSTSSSTISSSTSSTSSSAASSVSPSAVRLSLLGRLCFAYESFFGSVLGSGHLTVTRSMKHFLRRQFIDVSATTLHDRPPNHFKKLNTKEKHELLLSVVDDFPPGSLSGTPLPDCDEYTICTFKRGNDYFLRDDRPALLMSSTSWTPDEDFTLLLDAVKHYDEDERNEGPELLLIITGRGPLLSHYRSLISSLSLRRVRILTSFVSAPCYAGLLGTADLGVSLHVSSSGHDLPMKVVDMFGCALPVCAVNFQCINELIEEGVTGYTFKTSQELCQQIKSLFSHFPSSCVSLCSMSSSISSHHGAGHRWSDLWPVTALPEIERAVQRGNTNAVKIARSAVVVATIALVLVMLGILL